jgi:hypothetical protein
MGRHAAANGFPHQCQEEVAGPHGWLDGEAAPQVEHAGGGYFPPVKTPLD